MATFDFTTFLKNSWQIEMAKLAATLASTTEGDYYKQWESMLVNYPSSEAMFYSTINAGHSGTTSLIEYSLHMNVTSNNTTNDSFTYVWEIKSSGGSWQTLTSSSWSSNSQGYHGTKRTGTFSTAINLPAEIRFVMTGASAVFKVSTGYCITDYVDGLSILRAYPVVRCIGSV